MTDGQIFLVVFIAIYLSDCFCWGSRSALAFLSPGRRRWRLRRPGDAFGNDRGGLLFLWPLPPLGTVFLAEDLPLSFSEMGVGTTTPASPNPGSRVPVADKFVRWDAIESVAVEEKWILVNDVKFLKCAGSVQARVLGKRLLRWRRRSAEARRRYTRALVRASFDGARIQRLVSLHGRATCCLRILANTLMLACFLGVPLAFWQWHGTTPFFVFLLVLPLMMIQIALEAFRLHRKLSPIARGDRWMYFFIQLFVPQFAMRALDPLSRHLLWRFHPLAVASVLLERRPFEKLAGAIYRDLLHPVPYHLGNADAQDASTEYRRSQLLPAIEDFLVSQELSPEALAAPPANREEAARGYCPRCLAQFVIDGGICDSCGEMPARAFP